MHTANLIPSIHLATVLDRGEMIRILCSQNGINQLLIEYRNALPIHEAVRCGHTGILRTLLALAQDGTDIGLNSIAHPDNLTPLDLAYSTDAPEKHRNVVPAKRREIIELLRSHGALRAAELAA